MNNQKTSSVFYLKSLLATVLTVALLISAFPAVARADETINGFDLYYELTSNYKEIKNAFPGNNIVDFVWKVREGGAWDYKTRLGYNTVYNCLLGDVFVKLTGEEIGNINYGFVGSYLFNSEVLKAAGGLVQIATNSMRKGDIDLSSCDLQSYCDQPDDTEAIQRGIDLYNGKSIYKVFADKISSDITNVTEQFANKTVRIKSVESGGYVFGEDGSNVRADGQKNAAIFETGWTADGWLGFQQKGGQWLSVQSGDYLQFSGKKLQAWECFRIYKIEDNYYLFSQKNGRFVQVTNEPGRPLKAARTIGSGFTGATWERFKIELL